MVMEEIAPKNVTSVETVIDPLHLFVSLFIDEGGKIFNFSLVEYSTVEKWQQDESLEYGVAEIFTNADRSVDKNMGLLGTFFNCAKCKTVKEFGVVVMQKREVIPVTEEEPQMDDNDVEEEEETEESENTEEHQVITVDGRIPIIEEVPTDELEDRLVEYSSSSLKRKPPPLTMMPKPSQNKHIRMTFVDASPPPPVPEQSKDEMILGIKFYNKRSCNKCGYTPENEELLQSHVIACRESQIEPCKKPYATKLICKGGQRIRSSYICSKCTLSILHRDLVPHAEFHVKFAPYACKCSKCFATEDELAEHSQICGQHLFTCKMCHKEFVKKRDLFQHRADVHGQGIHGQKIEKR